MGKNEYDNDTTRSFRQQRNRPNPLETGEDTTTKWRPRRGGATRSIGGLPASQQELVSWLQNGGWRIALIVAGVVALLILALIVFKPRSNSGVGVDTAATSSALGSQVDSSALPTPTVLAEQQTAAAADSSAAQGVQFRVFNTGVEGLFLRPDPNVNNQPITTLPEGTVVTIIGDDFNGPDRVWKNIRTAEGSEGWVASDYLQAVDS